ncbi:YhgE/Pip domain-containing protein [Methanobrevibacter sp.]|uniref:YhgE/Pip domain-containing protein n=1 Tax=Methanobrevibacter sp. TaxID=66852 RepID=UPI0025F2AB5C|nr:YhgE/Pip domain-containing protein [Methanobrevibacter sp.]MBQ2962709.1 YhgE/Pip domain-containing protein [Methanobrevibacter sp.]
MSRKDPKMIAEIMKKNFKGAFSNPIVVIVLIGVIILPSLYALLNIQACWDPYGNTGDVPFAIANLDEGASFNDKDINIGKELVKDLKKNDKFKWTFVSEDDLRKGVYNGTYYAGIVIPKNLSENIVSITGDNPQQAKLEYIVNMKTNPVATKLTDSGANAVYTSLNAKIVEIIDIAAYQKLGELQEGLAEGAKKLANGGKQLQAGNAKVQAGASQVKNGESQVKDGANQVKSGASALNDGASQLKQGSDQLSDGASQVEKGSEELSAAVDPSLIPDGPIKDYAEGNSKLADGSSQVAEGGKQLANGANQLADGGSQLANGTVQVAEGSSKLAEGSVSLASGASLLSNGATNALFAASSSLGSTANTLGGITGIDEDTLGDYFLSPVQLERNELFPVNSYGSDVSPFYLVLSMWVGAVITCVMLKPGTSQGTKYSPFEMYFGKLLTYIIMSILQACVTIGGCYLLGIQIVNPILFIASCILVSMIFMILIYSIISAIGTVGKAIGVILLVLQISATGGIYPIQIMHPFFRALYPYMPMTYGITLVREAQLGVVWSNYIPALIILLAIGCLTITVAVIIKEKLDKPSHYFEEKLEESGLF